MASGDEASNICQALDLGPGGGLDSIPDSGGVAGKSNRITMSTSPERNGVMYGLMVNARHVIGCQSFNSRNEVSKMCVMTC